MRKLSFCVFEEKYYRNTIPDFPSPKGGLVPFQIPFPTTWKPPQNWFRSRKAAYQISRKGLSHWDGRGVRSRSSTRQATMQGACSKPQAIHLQEPTFCTRQQLLRQDSSLYVWHDSTPGSHSHYSPPAKPHQHCWPAVNPTPKVHPATRPTF